MGAGAARGVNAFAGAAQDVTLGDWQGLEMASAKSVLDMSAGFVPGGGTALSLFSLKHCQ